MSGFKTWLVLGRISNLTTVWSNALCAWILGSTGPIGKFVWITTGLSLFYIGGMCLNDYFDAGFDQKYRPERPIPSGKAKRNAVLTATIMLFFSGAALIIWTNKDSFIYILVLLALIVGYNVIHKRNALIGISLMASCRSAIYLIIGSASTKKIPLSIWFASILMFFYISGITALARNESNTRKAPFIAYIFLIIPIAGTIFAASPYYKKFFLISFFITIIWFVIIFYRARETGTFVSKKTIGPLLAGICLVDLAILSSMHSVNLPTLGLFLGFFILALLAQRFVPAT